MRRTSKLVRTAGALSAFALIGTACAGDSSDEDVTPEGTETTASEPGSESEAAASGGEVSTYIGEPEHLFPQNSNESEGSAVLAAVFTGLVDYDVKTTEPFNQVAESIETEDDGKTYTVTLKDGWTFHDGSPVTASSFVDAWNFGAHAPNAMGTASFFTPIVGFDDVNPPAPEGSTEAPAPSAETMSGLKVVDDKTFTIELKEADPNFPLQLGYTAFYPLPESAFEDPEAFEQKPIGNGPFQVSEEGWQHNELIRVEKYADYAGSEPAKVDAIEFRIYADVNTAYNDLLAGSLDIVDALPPERIEEARGSFGDKFGESPSSSINYLGFPSYVAELQDPNMRAALSMAVDRQTIADVIFSGNRAPANSMVNPVIPGHRPEVCENWTFNPEKAKQLFDEAGGYEGTMTIWFNSGAGHDEWIEAVKNMWVENLGMSADQFAFEQLDFAQYLPKMDNKELTGPFRLGWGMDYPSPQNYLEPIFASYNVPPQGSNTTFYNNPEFDSLIEQGNTAGSLEAGIPFYQQAEDLLCQDTPIAPMFFGLNQYASSDRVQDLYVDAFSQINYTGLSVTE